MRSQSYTAPAIVCLFGVGIAFSSPITSLTTNPTIDQMMVEDLWRTYFTSQEPALFLIQKPTKYILSDGSSWLSDAGVGQQYTTRVSQVTIQGDTIVYTMDRPIGAPLFGWTDYDAGDHQAQGMLAATAPLLLTADIGSPVATLSGYAEIVSNEPTAWGEDEFNYYSASIGDWVPFYLSYTLHNGFLWEPETFNNQFDYDVRGVVDFEAAIPEPTTALQLAIGTSLLGLRRQRPLFSQLRRRNGQVAAPR